MQIYKQAGNALGDDQVNRCMGMDLSYSYDTHFEIGICVSMGVVQSIENGDLI